MDITLSLPWLATLPLSALLDTLPDGWVVADRMVLGGATLPALQRGSAFRAPWEWVPVFTFGDYARRMTEAVQTIAEACADPGAYLAALYARREQAETTESLALAERAHAAWVEVQR